MCIPDNEPKTMPADDSGGRDVDTHPAPGALLCAWVDVLPQDRNEFQNFHDREHMFERLAVPGFRRGRRFGAISASSEFLILYEVDDLATLASETYLARLNAPTPWTLRSIPLVRKARRANIKLAYSRGHARGGVVLCIRFDSTDFSTWSNGTRELCDQLILLPGILAIRAGTSDELTSNIETAESITGGRTGHWVRQGVEQVLIVEAVSADVLRPLLEDALSEQCLINHGARVRTDAGIYGMQICVEPMLRKT
jgi:hypothetical protein